VAYAAQLRRELSRKSLRSVIRYFRRARFLIPSAAMRLDDLSKDEQLALGGLIRLMLRSDGEFTDAEEEKVNQIGARLADPQRLWSVISASAQAHMSDASIRTAAESVLRPEVRALVREVLTEVARDGSVTESEQKLLDWLTSIWK